MTVIIRIENNILKHLFNIAQKGCSDGNTLDLRYIRIFSRNGNLYATAMHPSYTGLYKVMRNFNLNINIWLDTAKGENFEFLKGLKRNKKSTIISGNDGKWRIHFLTSKELEFEENPEYTGVCVRLMDDYLGLAMSREDMKKAIDYFFKIEHLKKLVPCKDYLVNFWHCGHNNSVLFMYNKSVPNYLGILSNVFNASVMKYNPSDFFES